MGTVECAAFHLLCVRALTSTYSPLVALGRGLLEKQGSKEPPKGIVYEHTFDSKKSREVLGLHYHGMEETAAFMISDFKAKGWC